MKISPTLFQTIPSHIGKGICVYGAPTDEVKIWATHHSIKLVPSGPCTNIELNKPAHELFEDIKLYAYVDGFSPNLNKHLHIGHLSNLVYAKTFQALGVGEQFVAMLGDTLNGEVSHNNALAAFKSWCQLVGYSVSKEVMASSLTYPGDLVDGQDKYTGTKGFIVNGKYIVGLKSNGETSYFYHDAAFAAQLNASTLYLTGMEQTDHFKVLGAMYPHIKAIPLGLVQMDGVKMSSSAGNVVMLQDVWDQLTTKLSNNPSLVWNVVAASILKAHPSTAKKVSLKSLLNVKDSAGLYLSYTLARLKSAGVSIEMSKHFADSYLGYAYLCAKHHLNPSILMTALLQHAQIISAQYVELPIKGNATNQAIFKTLGDDLLLGMVKLGLHNVDKV